jgi:UDP-4-amino-4,6-dideoxy-N-acetyl-beta-L-altrosamine transaminase
MIPYARQDISDDDIEAVVAVLRSDWLTGGPAIERFEQAVAHYCGAQYAVAVSSATAALHIACLAAGLGEGDALWTSPNTFVASANCALYCGARPGFVDIDPATLNLSADALEQRLAEAQQRNALPKVLVPVHFAGQSCDMRRIGALAKRYGVAVIEDASHAIGGRYLDGAVGSCQFSDMTVFSFHPVKIVTSGEGGMVVTNNRALYDKLVLLRSHGVTRNPAEMVGEAHGSWYYEQVALGFNYRMTELQAALGASQMARIDLFVERRQALARRYASLLRDLPLVLPASLPEASSATHLYVVRLKLDAITATHRAVFEDLRARGIGVNLHYIPVHTQPYYRELGFAPGDFPHAEQYYREAISLPMFPGLSDAAQDQVAAALREVLR